MKREAVEPLYYPRKHTTQMELIASGTVTTLLAGVAAGVTDTGANLWAIAAVAVSIPLAFYVIHKVMGLFPKAGGRRA